MLQTTVPQEGPHRQVELVFYTKHFIYAGDVRESWGLLEN